MRKSIILTILFVLVLSINAWSAEIVLTGGVPKEVKAKLVDLYPKVCIILGIPLEKLDVNVVVFKNEDDYKRAFTGWILPYGAYSPDNNTLYLVGTRLEDGYIAHELAHAIICRYCGMTVPPKSQEILAGYAEYMIRKMEVKR